MIIIITCSLLVYVVLNKIIDIFNEHYYDHLHRKYVVLGGQVVSQTDGDTHYISADRLMRLYSVRMEECIIINDNRTGESSF
jgi:hypothetical protein